MKPVRMRVVRGLSGLLLAMPLMMWLTIGPAWAADAAEPPSSTHRASGDTGKKKIVFIAGPDRPSHGYAQHEHHAGCVLLAEWLRSGLPNVETTVCADGWPNAAGDKAFHSVDAIVVCANGRAAHPLLSHLDQVDALMKRGVGLGCIHFAVDLPQGKPSDCLKEWIGGCFEPFWSVKPTWAAEFRQLPNHPVTRGVRPFVLEEEWFYHMRFIDDMAGVTPILTAIPPDSTRHEGNDDHGANPFVRARKGMAEHVAWVRVRPDGGRGFGLTGGHSHWSWANRDYRTFVLNCMAWAAKIDIPPGGVPSTNPTLEALEANQAEPPPPGFDREQVKAMIERWQTPRPAAKATHLTNPLAIRVMNYGKYQRAAWTHLPSLGMHYVFLSAPMPDQMTLVKNLLAEHHLSPLVFRGWTDPGRTSGVSSGFYEDYERKADLGPASSIDEMAARLAVCEEMGVKYLFLSQHHTGISKEETYERLRRLGEIARKHGVTIVLETHQDLGNNAAVHLETMQRVNHPNVRVNFDTGNITFYNKDTDAVTELKQIIDYVATIELKDHNGQYRVFNFPALGKGVVDFPGVLKVLEEHHFQGPIVLEVEGVTLNGVPMTEDQTKQFIAESVRYIQSLGDFK